MLNDFMLGSAVLNVADPWASELGERITRARKRARLTQQELARRTDVSKVWISKLERGQVARPGLRKLNQLSAVLGQDVIPPEDEHNVVARVDDPPERRLPIYSLDATGNPVRQDEAPNADFEQYPPPGRESLIGPNGFGVIAKHAWMAGAGINDGDIVWINPDRHARNSNLGPANRSINPVLARTWREDGYECGMVVALMIRGEDGDRLYGLPEPTGLTPVACARFEVIGPVVGISPAFSIPR